jgi:hypothetical protein
VAEEPVAAAVRDQFIRWKDDPLAFVREAFGVEPDGWQADVLTAFAPKNGHKRIAVRACKNPGKTAVDAWLMWNFALTRPHPKIIATSISGPNLADGLWSELAKWQKRCPLLLKLFTWTRTQIAHNDHASTWFMAARQWSQSATADKQADTLAGKHADYMLFVLDEVGGIPRSVMAAAEAALGSGIETKLVISGNPTSLESPLYDACTTHRKFWKVFELTGDPDDPKRAPRVDIEWARQEIEKWGRSNPYVMANVLGLFPPSSINALLGVDEVTAAMGRHLREDQYSFAQKRLGVDVARFGDDRTIIAPRQGLAAFKMAEMRNARTHDIAARVAQSKVRWGSEMEFVDETGGYGAGVVDALLQAGYSPVGVNFAGKAVDPRYANKRAEMHFLMAEWVKRGGALPNDPELVRELTALTYTFHHGKMLLEDKDQIKARLGFSPDKADALCMTFAMPEMPAATMWPGQDNSRMKHDWNPSSPERA